jgi:hypothetical protein
VRQQSDQTKKPAQPTAAKGSTTARVNAATYDGTSSWLDYKSHFDACSRINQCFHFLTIDLYESKHQSETYNLTMMMYHHRLQHLHVQ